MEKGLASAFRDQVALLAFGAESRMRSNARGYPWWPGAQRRKAPATTTLTDAEAVAMMKSHVAWTGKYSTADQTPEGIKLIAHVDAAPAFPPRFIGPPA